MNFNAIRGKKRRTTCILSGHPTRLRKIHRILYRDIHKFQIFTCTKTLSTRLLFFLIAILEWNCWQAVLIWVRALKSYSNDLPRNILIELTLLDKNRYW
ncbi:MAG: hypothetical protein GF317_22715 [Candidatus Lokiarchaeota archaeon]|nr:hypothetical protein [Candidatus Lokiarchaeota archaeon]MBD3202279.1 hypothetical protein [Candidatus Lokiarchaeota archaeon]